jgi:hypothetical protein
MDRDRSIITKANLRAIGKNLERACPLLDASDFEGLLGYCQTNQNLVHRVQ